MTDLIVHDFLAHDVLAHDFRAHDFRAGDPVVVRAPDVAPFAGRISAVGGGTAQVAVGLAVLRFRCVDLRHAHPCFWCGSGRVESLPRPRTPPEAVAGLPGGG